MNISGVKRLAAAGDGGFLPILSLSYVSVKRGVLAAIAGAMFCLLSSHAALATTLLGPVDPTALPLPQNAVTASGFYGAPGGATWTYGNIQLANSTQVWHTDFPNGVRFNALGAQANTFSPTASNLSNGILVFYDNLATPLLRATLSYTTLAGAPIALATPASVGAPTSVGGLAPVPTAGFKLNFIFEILVGGTWTPAMLVSNSQGSGGIQFSSDFSAGYYWNNVDPKLTVNAGAPVTQNQSVTLTPAVLQSTDVESPASAVTYTLNGVPHNGVLKKNATALAVSDTFTQQDIIDGKISYANGGACDTNDDFQFGVADANGGVAHDGAFTSFSFHFTISLPNNPPTANNASISVGLGAARSGVLTASNNDCIAPTYTYTIATSPTKGALVLNNAGTGAYTYTATVGQSGPDAFTFNVFDGVVSSPAPGTISVTIANQPPTAQGQTIATSEGSAVIGSLVATDVDQPPQTLTYSIVANGSKGTAAITNATTGAFTYTPTAGRIGADTFTFKANDGLLDSNTATVTVAIRPNTGAPGRLVTTGGATSPGGNGIEVVAVDPLTGEQGVISKGGLITNATGLAIESTGKILVMNMSGSASVLRIDPADGSQLTLASGFSPPGPSSPGVAIGVAVESNGNILAAAGASGVVRINPVTGAITNSFTGGNLAFPVGVALAPNGDIYVTDAAGAFGGTNRVIKIDPSSGAQTVISSGGSLLFPIGITMTPTGHLYVTDAPGTFGGSGTQAIYEINPSTGAQTPVLAGGVLVNPLSIAFAADGSLLTVNHGGPGSIARVTPGGGSPVVVSSGGELASAWGLAVAKASQTISFTSTAPASAVVGGAAYIATATASSGLTVSFTSATTSICSISGSTVSFIAVGTCTVNADQAGNASYSPAPRVQQTFTVGKGSQTVAFTSTAPAGAVVNGPTYTVIATASSGLTVAFTSAAASICSVSGSTVSFLEAGTCVINANQAGNANYNAAPQVQQTFTVGKGSQTIAFTSTPPANAIVGGGAYTVVATASSGLTVTFASGAPAICSVAGSTVGFLAAGTCVINANQAGNANYNAAPQVQQSVTVNAPATHTWVSRNGSDANVCSATAPCLTFQAAHDATGANGDINCFNSGDYGQLTINKSISVKCTSVMASIAAGTGAGITISAGVTDKIVLDGLDIEGLSTGSIGISVGSASKVHVLNTTIRNFSDAGVALNGSNTHVFIDQTFVLGNPTGVRVQGTNNIASLTNSSVRASPTASLNAATPSAIIGAQSSVINDSPVGIARVAGAQVISVGPSNLVTGAGSFTLTLPFD